MVRIGDLGMINDLKELLVQPCMTGTHDTDRHLLTLFAIALACKGKTYIELGVLHGKTTLPILMAAYQNGGELVSVDKEHTSFQVSGPAASHWQFVRQDAIEFLEQWDSPIDFVFIDDWHSYRHVKRELELIGKWIGPSGVILLHDLMYGGHDPLYRSDPSVPEDQEWGAGGPYRAVAELDTSVWEWATLPWGHGLTLLRKKRKKK